ncbi:MAG: ABC transporter permease [Acidimicrobiia bacterium]|nr:ABC transporter permease [Acidimicrobiia bacterium]
MRSILPMFRASMRSIVRDRQTLIGATVFPTIFLLAFAAFDIGLTGAGLDTTGGGIDYFDFVLPGILGMATLQFAIFWTSGSYARMGETKVLRRLEATPVPKGAFLVGQVLARLVLVAVQAAVVLGVGVVMGADIAGNLLWMIVLTLLGAATFLSLGFAIGARAANVDAAGMMSGIAVMPIVFLSGAWFPIEGLPGWLETVMNWLPLAPLLEAMRSVMIEGAGIGAIGGEIAQVVAWIPVMFGVAVLAMRPASSRASRRRLRTAEAVA